MLELGFEAEIDFTPQGVLRIPWGCGLKEFLPMLHRGIPGGVWWVQEKTTASWSYDGRIVNDAGAGASGMRSEGVDVNGSTGMATGSPTGESRPKNAYVHYPIQ